MKNCIPVQLDDLVHATVRGEDALAFLQGQLSNDLRLLDATQGQIGSYNSAKGRMLAVTHLLRMPDTIVLELHRDVAAASCKRLRMFVLRAKVTVTEEATMGAFGLLGPDAAATLDEFDLPVPDDAPLACAHDARRGLVVMRRFGKIPRFSVHGETDALAPLLAAAGALQDFAHWRRADIDAGVPVVYAATADHFVPQMANLDLLGGISFDKGCYTGQEIVARLHYLGQLKRRMFVATLDGDPPAPGSDVHDANGASAGEIVDAVAEGTGSIAGVVLQLSRADDALRLADGRALKLLQDPRAS